MILIGENLTLKSGMSGTVWGVKENASGSFVQFAPDGEWFPLDVEAPAIVVTEKPIPAVAAVEQVKGA